MRFGLFYEHQLPRPWRTGDDDGQLLADALEQIELADRLGLDCIWLVEHHFLEESSHSSAPEMSIEGDESKVVSLLSHLDREHQPF